MNSPTLDTIEPLENPVDVPPGKSVLGVRIPDTCMVYRVQSDLSGVKVGDQVVVQIRDGESIGTVLHVFTRLVELHPGPIRKVIRRMTEKDLKFQVWRAEQEKKAQLLCRQKIREMQLAMKFSKVTYLSGGGKAIIYFTSESRVDFRELVRILSSELRVRVEMRHVGVRDESKLLCGLGSCGKTLCCSEYLTKFHPVSVRMAKNQDLSLTPEGISGVCGRLMCCLAYENDAYLAQRKLLPKAKSRVTLQDGREGTVRSVFPMLNLMELQFGDGTIEKMAVDKLAGEVGGQAEWSEESEDPVEEAGGRVKASSQDARSASGADKSARGRSDADRPRRGGSPPRRGAAAGKEPVKSVSAAPAALPASVEGAEAGEGGDPAKKRSGSRRKRRGGANRAVVAPVSVGQDAQVAKVSDSAGRGPEVEGAEVGGGGVRAPGRSRRRRRRSSSRRGGGEGGAPAAAAGGEGGMA